MASGVLNDGRQVGSAVGVALLGSLVAGTAHFESGMRVGLTISGCRFLVSTLIALTAVRGRRESVATV
ncbi:hypothetical protein [Streptomyces sp. NPDC057740]|uniref:hypothetical protein n=1 Tax=Streptomyces sp. NPDC057740 TaxID=3346234 RepID=UPI0036CE4909